MHAIFAIYACFYFKLVKVFLSFIPKCYKLSRSSVKNSNQTVSAHSIVIVELSDLFRRLGAGRLLLLPQRRQRSR